MEKQRSRYFYVSSDIPFEIRPLMAAFMSYSLHGNNKNKCKHVRLTYTLLQELADFLGYHGKESEDNPFRRYSKDFYSFGIGNYVRKDNGKVMTPIEQFNLFARILNEKGVKADCFLFQQGSKNMIAKTNENENIG
uniref:LAGLIDADG homing endonuclease n=1 Tax=Panagrolaimus sp. ES5 TaxID=591445 RepID=A0AC34GJZ8_9BILA